MTSPPAQDQADPAAPKDPARVAVITGGTSGIGRSTATLFVRHGWRVGLIARSPAGLAAMQESLGSAVATAVADVADPAALEAAATALERQLGGIKIWINCAGNGVFGRFLDVPAEEFERVTAVTYLGTVNGTRVALKRMVPRDSGLVINVCSAIAFRGMPLLSSYSGAKQAVRGFTEAVRAELAQEGSRVRIATVYPPAVNTPFFHHAASHLAQPPRPMRPVYQPEVVAEAILLAALTQGRRRQVRVSFTTVAFDLATRLAPWAIDRAVMRLGYDGQMAAGAGTLAARQPTLFAPSSTPPPATGDFDPESRRFSLQVWLARQRHRLRPRRALGQLKPPSPP